MNKLNIGNVIKSNGRLEIVTATGDDYTNTVSLEMTSVSFGHKTEDVMEKVECGCVDICNNAMEDCPDCKGTGKREKIRYGSDSAEFLARNVKEYIMDGLSKHFKF